MYIYIYSISATQKVAVNLRHIVLPVFPQTLLCQLAAEEDDAAVQTLLRHIGESPKEYHLTVLKKVVSQCLLLFILFFFVCRHTSMPVLTFSYATEGGTAATEHWEELWFPG